MKSLLFLAIASLSMVHQIGNQVHPDAYSISGELKKWHTVTLTFLGPETHEEASYNPFYNYRLNVTFTNGNKRYVVPGYFANDGNSAETSATGGNKWQVKFTPDEIGAWKYEASFRKGVNVAISEDIDAGESAGFFDQTAGQFTIEPSDKTGRDFRSQGRLSFVGKTYLQFTESGKYFLKAGADAPENLLSYSDFDGDFKTDGHKDELIKTWSPHEIDWNNGDPTWQDGKGKGLIGAINYLSEKGMNVVSFLTMNIAGDDQNVFPYTSYNSYDRIDVSKLAQWEVVFNHAQKKGMFLHFKTSEVENQGLLDNGDLGPERKLYYRELISRFGHHLALNWNIGEENGLWMEDHPTPFQTTSQRLACAQYFYDHDPYGHHIVIHNGQPFYDLLGPESKYTGLSIQTNREDFGNVHSMVLKWRHLARDANKIWANAVDEPGDHRFALVPDQLNPNHDNARQNALWGALMAGAWGIEWYFGYEHEHSDLSCEDWRSRDKMWDQSRFALDFFIKNNIPFWTMEPADEITEDPDDYVFTDHKNVYVVYQKIGKNKRILIPGLSGDFAVSWYNPKEGGFYQNLDENSTDKGLEIEMDRSSSMEDCVVLIRKK